MEPVLDQDASEPDRQPPVRETYVTHRFGFPLTVEVHFEPDRIYGPLAMTGRELNEDEAYDLHMALQRKAAAEKP